MRQFIIALAAFIAVVSLAPSAQALGPKVGVGLGYNVWLEDGVFGEDEPSAATYVGELGFRISALEVSLDVSYHTSDSDFSTNLGQLQLSEFEAEFSNLFIEANARFFPLTVGPIQPYVGGGIGAMISDLEYTSKDSSATAQQLEDALSNDGTSFTFKAIVGVELALGSHRIFGEVGYRLNLSEPWDVEDGFSALAPDASDFNNIPLTIGYRYVF